MLPEGRPKTCEKTVTALARSFRCSFVGPVVCTTVANCFSWICSPLRLTNDERADIVGARAIELVELDVDIVLVFAIAVLRVIVAVEANAKRRHRLRRPSARATAIFSRSILICVSGFPSSDERRTSEVPGIFRSMSATWLAEPRDIHRLGAG